MIDLDELMKLKEAATPGPWEAEKQQRLLAEHQRDEAIRTKAEIGSRREATAMNTASVAVRQRDALADRLGEGRKWKTVKAIPWLMSSARRVGCTRRSA